MKRLFAILSGIATGAASYAGSYTFTPTGNTDLSDLSHDSAYEWGITGSTETALKTNLSSGYHITSATITIKNIYNWDVADTHNKLFINLLDNPVSGITTFQDDPADQGVNQGTVSDYFDGNNGTNGTRYYGDHHKDGSGLSSGSKNKNSGEIDLSYYHDNDGPATKINYSFSLTAFDISVLTSYIGDGNGGSGTADFGLGFDPDCHFYNDGVSFTICTEKDVHSTPEGGVTAALFLFGLAGVASVRRYFRRR
jgi:hypothetical protein